MKAIYKGEEFPDFIGKVVEVLDDNSEPNAPCYKIRFIGESEWIDNMHDEDLDFKMESFT